MKNLETNNKMSLEEFNSSNFFSKSRTHVLLFIATFLTTYYVNGLWYSITIMTILLSHELGHFFMCRKYHVSATMPYFLPPPPLLLAYIFRTCVLYPQMPHNT